MFYRFECGCEGLFCGESADRIILRGCGASERGWDCPPAAAGFVLRAPFEASTVDRPLTDTEVSSLIFCLNGLIDAGTKIRALKDLIESL